MLTLWALPPAAGASAQSSLGRITIRHSFSFSPSPILSFSFPFPSGPTAVGTSAAGGGETTAAKHPSTHASASASAGGGYVSTFSPEPLAQAPNATGSVSCLANGQPVTGSGGDLDLPGIAGTSTDPGHSGALKITGFGPSSMIPPQIDSADLTELQITRPVDNASTNLAMVASSGYRFGCAHIEIGRGAGYSSAEYALVNAGLVADDRTGNIETLTVTYTSILWSYTEPGSSTLHTGSGQINARPDQMHANVVTDSRYIAEGTIGLTGVVALGLILLYVVGRRRNRKRYESRYYRRMASRARPTEYVQNQWYTQHQQSLQHQQHQQSQQVIAEEAVVQPEPEPDPVPEVVPEPVPEPVPEAEPAPEPVLVAEIEPEPEPEPETVESEPEESEEPEEQTAVAETEPEPEPEAESEPEAEAEPEAESEPEPELTAEAEPEPEEEPEPEADAEPEAEPEPEPEPVLEAEPEPEPEAEPEPESEPELEPEAQDENEGEEAEADEVADDEVDGDVVDVDVVEVKAIGEPSTVVSSTSS